ncbi:MAG TPA: ABC transporter substrate-binding protein [Ruminococcus sp.]|nr:ABC transporter substrate-binding protein [Ruminococcus sp.]
MKKSKKVLALTMAGCMMATAFAGCGGSSSSGSGSESGSSSKADTSGVKSIYFLNFKPEIADKYEAIAKKYKEETGIEVKVKTAASGEYEKTLTSEIAKSDPPTIFQINGPVGYQSWADYCADLKDTELYNLLSDKTLAVTKDEGVYGVPYAVEGYGIIYNDEIMQKYFKTDGAKAKSTDEIKSFDTLKLVVEDMTAKKDELGIDGVFGSTSLKAGDDWRWQTHLMNVPLYYEFNTGEGSPITNCLSAADLEFKYSDNYKNLFDLYTDNSCTDKKLLGSKTVDESMAEFATGKCAMIQNGNWAWAQVSGVDGNVVKEENIKFLPLYMGVEGEDKQGLCVGTENYFSINSQVDEATQQASIDFLEWLFTSDYGKKAVTTDLGFIAPFTSFGDDEKPTDPLAKEVLSWMEKDGMESVVWTFAGIPSENWKNEFGASLLEYVQGQKDWTKVVDDAKASWKTEREATAE